MNLREKLKRTLLPTDYDKPFDPELDQQIFQSLGLQRSGQHLVISWICHGFQDITHINHCYFKRRRFTYLLTPLMGRRVVYRDSTVDDSGIQEKEQYYSTLPSIPSQKLFYSLEDYSLLDLQVQRINRVPDSKTIIILRDPANWLASSLAHNRSSPEKILKKREIFIEYLEQSLDIKSHCKNQCITINYNRFIEDKKYRQQLSEKLGITALDRAESTLQSTPDFGGGSSFQAKTKRKSYLERWKSYKDDEFYQTVLRHPYFINLSMQFFGEIPGYKEMNII